MQYSGLWVFTAHRAFENLGYTATFRQLYLWDKKLGREVKTEHEEASETTGSSLKETSVASSLYTASGVI